MFVKEEKEFLVRLLSDVKVNPLSVEAVPMIQIIQSIARKVFAAVESSDQGAGSLVDESNGETKRKRTKKVDDGTEFA